MSMIVLRRQGAARVAAPTNPALPWRATASLAAGVVLALFAAGCAATDAVPATATTVAVSASPSPAGCPRPDIAPDGIPPARQLTGPTAAQYPDGAAPARPHLQDIARQVTSGPTDPTRCGRYDYVHVRGWTADGTIGPDGQATNQITLSDDRRWAGDDGSARVVSVRREDPAAPPATSSNAYPPGKLPTPLAGPLDTDPGILANTINTVYPWSRGAQSGIRAAAEIYTWHIPSRDQRAAIVQILADQPLIWRGAAVDRQGRHGVAVSADSDRGTIRDLLILDPHSGAVLAYEQRALRNPGLLNGPFPPVMTYQIYLDHHRQDDAS